MTHANTKAIRNAYVQYARSTATSLDHVYKSYSSRKMDAWHYCERLAKQYNAVTDLYIISHNSDFFSVGFEGMHEGRQAFFWITARNERFIYLDELV